MKNFPKKMIAILLSLLILFGSGVTAFAAHSAGETVFLSTTHRCKQNSNVGTTDPSDPLVYRHDNGTTTMRFLVVRIGSTQERTDTYAYCIEVGATFENNTYTTSSVENSSYWNNLSDAAQYGIIYTTMYGFPVNKFGVANCDAYVATQILIWEFQKGYRTISGGRTNATLYNEAIKGKPSETAYNELVKCVNSHTTRPSFTRGTQATSQSNPIKLTYDSAKGIYSATLTDTNGVLSGYDVTANAGFTVTKSGNTLTVSTSTAPTSAKTVTLSRPLPKTGQGVLALNSGVNQRAIIGQMQDPMPSYVAFEAATGSMKLVKTSEDGKVSGIKFTITGNGVNKTVTTGANGEIQVDDLNPGTYTVTEESISHYETQSSQKVTITSGQTATVKFNNSLRRGDLKVTKTSEDGLVEGMRFRLSGTSLSGQSVDMTVSTDKNGVATFSDVLVSGSTPYTLEEVGTPNRYVVPPNQTAAINWNAVTNKTVSNKLKKFRVTVTKKDSETGAAPQGDASLAGAVYGIYKGGELADSYTTDQSGAFTTEYYVCGEDWTVKEIEPSEGYLLDKTVHKIGAAPGNFTIERNSLSLSVTEDVKKGRISLIKHTDDGETQIETPEEGAVFQIYLSSTENYDKAKTSEKETLIADENGYMESKLLPYGLYTVHQVSGWEGRELLTDFQVMIAEHEKTYRFLINNAVYKADIEIVKRDAETKQIIPISGIGFKVRDVATGKDIVQKINYPTPVTIDTYCTDVTGKLMLPEQLSYGEYDLIEVQTAHGYVLDGKPQRFTVDGSKKIVTVDKFNMPQKGIVSIEKSGEVFATVQESGGVYQPVYEAQGLPDAQYVITAAEDIYTPDGTCRIKKDELADTVVTDEQGVGKSTELYLGKYEIKEVKAPDGMTLNEESHTVELVYAGQEISVTDTKTSYYNERQRVELMLEKHLEQDEAFEIGKGSEIFDVSFALYAEEEITAVDGSVIPENGLIELVSMGVDGTGQCKTDLPFGSYYLQEYATNAAYQIADTKYHVSFTYAGQAIPVVKVTANEDQPIENKIIRGSVAGMKYGENGVALGGALIGIFKPDATEFTEETAMKTVTSAENGSFAFSDIPYGLWLVREIKQPEGYVLKDELYPVEINEQGTVIEVSIINTRIRGKVQLTKIDREYPDNKLTGAIFEIYLDNGDGEYGMEDDPLLGTLEEVSEGIYEKSDLPYGGYFVREKEAPKGFILDENLYYFTIETDGEVVQVENEDGKGFLNAAQSGALRIVKKSSDGVLKGFTFLVSGKTLTGQEYSESFVTDEKGEIHINGLKIGEYTVEEVPDSANARYILPDAQTVTITHGETAKLEFYNKTKDAPKTGDGRNTELWISIACLSVAGILGLVLLLLKKKQSKKKK